MKKSTFLIIVVGLMLVAVLVLRFTDWGRITVSPAVTPTTSGSLTNGATSSPTVSTTTDQVILATSSEVIIISPLAGQVVTSPLAVSGQAKGPWFFEASLPVKLTDNNGQLIVQAPAQAQGNWMTTNLLPFNVNLSFSTTATSGYLVISKDNPSGLPANDASFQIPVKFQ